MTKKRSVGSKQQQVVWLPTMVLALLWGLGVGIFAWLAAGIACQRDYTDLTCTRQEWLRFHWPSLPLAQDVFIPLLFFVFSLPLACIFGIRKNRVKEGAQKYQSALHKILIIVAPILFLILAVAVLTVTFAAYNDPWKGNHLGFMTGFGALFASVGALATVSVTYKIGEENRKAQKEIEDEKGEREERKQDAELIKTLNDRLHEIIPRRYGGKPSEVSASYFQLAALYRDWETLAASSQLVEGQKESQQRNILKILFGVYQEDKKEPKNSVANTEVTESTSEESQQKTSGGKSRSQADIRTLNSVIQDIFPVVPNDWDRKLNKNAEGESDTRVFDLSYLDLRDLDFNKRYLKKAILKGASLEGAELWGASLEGAELWGAHLEGANLRGAHLEGADLVSAHLEDAKLEDAHLKGTYLWGAHLERAHFFEPEEDTNDVEARHRVIDQLKFSELLPSAQRLLQAEGFDQELVDAIYKARYEYWAEKMNSQRSQDQS